MKIRFFGKKNLNLSSAKKILVELPFGLGDKIMGFPLFTSLKKFNPKIEITVLSPNASSTTLLKLNPFIDTVLEYRLPKFKLRHLATFSLLSAIKLRREIKRKDFDFLIILHPNHFRTFLAHFLPVQTVIMNIENIHKSFEAKNVLDTLNIPFIADYSISLQENNDILAKYSFKKKSYILIDRYAQHLKNDPRQWPYFDEFIEKLKKRGLPVVLVGQNPKHKSRFDVIDLVNKTSFEELFYLIKDSLLTISMDTGLFHFSYALNTPVIALFGPVNPKDRAPLDNNLKVETLYNAKDCSPCITNKVNISCANIKNPYCCMNEITVEMLMEKLDKMLS